jgi:hypothetical protein
MHAYYSGRKCHWDFAIPYLIFLCRLCLWVMHSQPYHLCSVLPWQSAYLLQPHLLLSEQWLEIRSVCHPGNLVSCSQVFSPDKPVSMFFDACAAIDKGGCGGTGCGCGDLALERAYTSNDKCMCQGDNSWPCDDVGSYYCPYWGCVSWATWQRACMQPSFTRGKLPLTTPGASVTL